VDEDRQPGPDGRSDELSARDAWARAADSAAEALPPALRERLEHCADDWVNECASQRAKAHQAAERRSRFVPWLLATASLALAILGWWPRVVELERGVAAAGGFTQWWAVREREQMLRTAGVQHAAWGGAGESGAGDVVWDPHRQRGFLRLSGFVPNDPDRAQYQLWIFDAARDERYPVDGGVFDVPPGRDDVLIPVHPTLPVSRAVAFAITVERPGGVVVSAREKIVGLAKPGG
jgi:hypothetical protein